VRTKDAHAARILRTAFAPLRCSHRAAAGDAVRTVEIPALGSFEAAFRSTRDLFARLAENAAPGGAFYGGCGAFGRSAFALFGASTVGKTILLLHLANIGAHFLGDETFALDEAGMVRAMPRLPALREPGVALLPRQELRYAVLRAPYCEVLPNGRLWFALRAEDLLGITPDPRPCELRAVIFLERGIGHPRVDEVTPTQGLAAATQRLYRKPRDLAEIARLRRTLRDVRAYRLLLGPPARTAELLAEHLQCA
jgi:hypothetical protein